MIGHGGFLRVFSFTRLIKGSGHVQTSRDKSGSAILESDSP